MKLLPEMKASLLLLPLLVASAHAATLVNTTFDHGASDISGSTSPTFFDTTGWNSGSNNVRYESSVTASWAGGDSDYTLLPSGFNAGGAMAASPASTNITRGMQLDLGVSLTGTFWISALMQLSSTTADTFGYIGFENGTITAGGAPDHGGFGFRSDGSLLTTVGSIGTDTGVDLPGAANTWHLFLAKITVDSTGAATDTNDAISLWVFDASSSIGGQTEAALGTATYTSSSMRFGSAIQDVWFGANRTSTGTTAYLDNLRVSNLGTDAGLLEVLNPIPEPGTALALAFAAGLLAVRRRR